jgi:hypothetical protein
LQDNKRNFSKQQVWDTAWNKGDFKAQGDLKFQTDGVSISILKQNFAPGGKFSDDGNKTGRVS